MLQEQQNHRGTAAVVNGSFVGGGTTSCPPNTYVSAPTKSTVGRFKLTKIKRTDSLNPSSVSLSAVGAATSTVSNQTTSVNMLQVGVCISTVMVSRCFLTVLAFFILCDPVDGVRHSLYDGCAPLKQGHCLRPVGYWELSYG